MYLDFLLPESGAGCPVGDGVEGGNLSQATNSNIKKSNLVKSVSQRASLQITSGLPDSSFCGCLLALVLAPMTLRLGQLLSPLPTERSTQILCAFQVFLFC